MIVCVFVCECVFVGMPVCLFIGVCRSQAMHVLFCVYVSLIVVLCFIYARIGCVYNAIEYANRSFKIIEYETL